MKSLQSMLQSRIDKRSTRITHMEEWNRTISVGSWGGQLAELRQLQYEDKKILAAVIVLEKRFEGMTMTRVNEYFLEA